MHVDRLLWLIIALPFLGFLINGLLGSRFEKPTIGIVAVLGPLAAFVLSILATIQAHEGHPASQIVWQWIATGGLALDSGLLAAIQEEMLTEKLGVTALSHADSIYAGAIGAALWGAFRHAKLNELQDAVAA